MWRAAVAGGVEFVPGQVITTGTNPLAKDTQYEAIQRFQEVMRAYLTHSGQKDYADKDHFLKDDGDGEMMVAGWIAGEVLSQALGSREWVKDRKSFLASLYNQRRYVVDDIVIGDYGGDCVTVGCIEQFVYLFLRAFFFFVFIDFFVLFFIKFLSFFLLFLYVLLSYFV
ncbi:putative receptor-type adenylate cyclase [Trypanosoma cruzi]|uniref:Receptor-type adenylate cyclase, putative n=2 Tax=Trypanosoma cruzi TaxID=5693 RepID=Q4CQN4_TRYCC|nr:receptor-type adenylate cyclase, putative [Trypanosoma cruzi]EAN82586.1 receptor-type adenylate cyclase, putative [Trypanosoma cruzi]KAF8293907.1 putative receptor-type adenylate cyclase [Trypanosoma cruzi]PWV09212.1 putative receptor-type adenylate cyclase [Trypanosoma cruzi]|eukprot:XP_804437.1 receptor-type adenylate cyclase [Trypanosoma cruzi strain CL Brener]